MNYGYPGVSDSEIIKNYKVIDGVIVVKYLDGSSDYLCYSDSEVEKIEEQMIEQAIDRDNSLAFFECSANKKILSVKIAITMMSSLGFAIASYCNDVDFFYSCFSGISGCLAFDSISEYLSYRDEAEELSKYRTYLTMMDKLDSIEDHSSLYQSPERLTIHTLDDFSSKEVKNIYKTLKSNSTGYAYVKK
ncbi:MAG TPA: hypothetical protein IAB35_01115 [Candidatus Faecimonas gallistercoris]|nr:hypothetical protein [Candidatus Faecimonas gallistercoris]